MEIAALIAAIAAGSILLLAVKLFMIKCAIDFFCWLIW